MESDPKGNPDDEKNYRFELYKSLRGEATSYVEKVPGLWLQKFALVGGVIAFLIAKHAEISSVGSGKVIVGAAIVLIPLLAALLDAKIMEYGLHARAISRFLAEKYPSPAVLAEWENCMWGDGTHSAPARMAWLRNELTVAVTVVPTAALIFLSGIVLAEITERWAICLSVAAVLSLLYLASAVAAWLLIWPRRKA